MTIVRNDDVESVVVLKPGAFGRYRAMKVYGSDHDDDDDDDGVRVRVLKRAATGRVRVADVYPERAPRKKQSKLLRPFEKAVRKSMRRRSTFASHYISLHERSNRRKKNGWLSDLGKNLFRAYRRGRR